MLKAVFRVSTQESEAMRKEKFIKEQKNRKIVHQILNSEKLTRILAGLFRIEHWGYK